MTPAVVAANQAGIAYGVHEYAHDPMAESFGREAADALGILPERVFKTLIASSATDARRLVVAVVPVAQRLNLKALASAVAEKKMVLAERAVAERATGYVIGGISPLGQRQVLPFILDVSALSFPTIFVSAGRRGLELELAPGDLLALTGGSTGSIAY